MPFSPKSWDRRMRRFHRESGGVTEMYILRPEDPRIWRAVRDPNHPQHDLMIRLTLVVGDFITALESPQHNWPGPPHCIACRKPINATSNLPHALIVQAPFAADWAHKQAQVIVSAACIPCSAKLSDDELSAEIARLMGSEPVEKTRMQ